MTNRLVASTSPYLRQHADNPVDWFPWGDEAFAVARDSDRPVLLSVGYSACHWCHVMAHESFADPVIAGQMNASFVNVKVDREERPDVDALYMEAVQALTGQGGWPMTVFLTPDGEPFFGGTYFPPEPRRGMAAFPQVLAAVAAAWRDRRADVLRSAGELSAALRGAAAPAPTSGEVSTELLARATERLIAGADRSYGGFRGGQKFPAASSWLFLLGRHVRTGDGLPLTVVTEALDAMAQGGLYDHLGGGFHRYCVDEHWTVPHFEKMLYDNAQLVSLYTAAWQLTGAERYRQVVLETVEYLLREMVGPHGAFQATQDADTPGGEGASFVWTPAEVRAALPAAEASVALAWFGITADGNFDGANVLSVRRSEAAVAAELRLDVATLAARRSAARAGLLAARARRPQPATDTKVIVSWNGLAIAALARAGAAMDRADWVAAAARAARFVRDTVAWRGALAHGWHDEPAPVPAFLDDTAAMAGAYTALYEVTGDATWLAAALELTETLRRDFEDAEGGFYRTGPGHEALVARQMDLLDASVPSGTALAVDALLRLAALTESPSFERSAAAALRRARPYLAGAPGGTGALLSALDDYMSGIRAVAIVGPAARADTRALLAVARARWLPGTVVAWGEPDSVDPAVALLAGRPLVAGRATAYVCHSGTCRAPVTEPLQLAAELTSPPGR